ncbi:unnamed protein product [Lactuca virosa]|uniref:Replication protein A 70 kDa DNA-binding subunit B/D first OB fold domain-containing protein n=1 Tax=Lactuca virosa TaxID=75947 RepID=A0AAU9P309_9ASTR|nr:unnamed protein product [Lactuca virosa]
MDSDICRDMSTTNITFIADLDVTRDDLIIKVRVINHWKQMSFYNKNEIWSIELILVDEQEKLSTIDDNNKRDMSITNITFIADLDVTRDDLIIKVRVINDWKQMSFYNKNEIWSIELILVDEQGSKIQASVPKKFLYRFKNVLKDGKSYYITSPSFAALKANTFRLIPQDQKLTFVQETVVKECTQFSGPKFGFSFVDFQSVLSMVHPQNLSLDVIGLVVGVGEMATESTDKSKHKIHIHIQNENGLEIRLVLWGDYAYQMQKYIQDNPQNLQIIVILQFAQINVWRDRPSVNTYYTSSRLFINSDIDESSVFKKRLQRDDRPDSSSHTFSLIPANQVSEYDDFMVKNKLKTISEVWEPVEIYVMICTFILVGTIKGILQNEKWFYQACTNCSSKAVPNNDQVDGTAKSYECHNGDCTKTTTSVVPRKVFVEEISQRVFNNAAKNGDNVDLYPVEMNALKGLKFAFKISSNIFNVSKKTNQYGIARITDDESLIEQLEDKLNSSQDAISATDDNITPNTLDKNSATSPLKISTTTTPVLKRNLQEVFELESNEKFSSSKTPKTSPAGPRKELLKVKVEKDV